MMNFLGDSLTVFISSEIVWIDKLDYFQNGIYFPTMVAMETKKMQFLNYHSNGCYKEKKLLQKLESYRFKPSLQKLG